MHHQTRSWARLTLAERDALLRQLGVDNEVLQRVRLAEPKLRILEAARVALNIDDEPNSDLIEYIAGYAPRSAVYHHYSSMAELYAHLGVARDPRPLPTVQVGGDQIDLASTLPQTISRIPVHLDDVEQGRLVRVWQKLNGGMRSVVLRRVVRTKLLLAGVVLYSGEGTKSLKSGRVEVANSNPSVLRLHMMFMEELGLAKDRIRARVQVHASSETEEATRLWSKELSLPVTQFVKPMLSSPGKPSAKRTFTLQVSYANTMLLHLLRYWSEGVDSLYERLESR